MSTDPHVSAQPAATEAAAPPVGSAPIPSGGDSAPTKVSTVELDAALANTDALMQDIEHILLTETGPEESATTGTTPGTSASQNGMGGETALNESKSIDSSGGSTSEPATSNGPQNLQAIDQLLADDVATMLEGDFESIDAVLEGVFEEHAVLVQEPNEKPAAPPRRAPSPPASVAPVIESPPTIEPEAVVPPAPAEPIAAVTKAAQEPTPAEHAVAAPAVTAAPASPPSNQSNQSLKAKIASLMSKLSPALVPALMIVNYPLRFVPRGFQRVLNVVAVSLALWVPVVFILAPGFAARSGSRPVIKVHGESKLHEEGGGHGETKKAESGNESGHGESGKSKKAASSSHDAPKKTTSKKSSGHG